MGSKQEAPHSKSHPNQLGSGREILWGVKEGQMKDKKQYEGEMLLADKEAHRLV